VRADPLPHDAALSGHLSSPLRYQARRDSAERNRGSLRDDAAPDRTDQSPTAGLYTLTPRARAFNARTTNLGRPRARASASRGPITDPSLRPLARFAGHPIRAKSSPGLPNTALDTTHNRKTCIRAGAGRSCARTGRTRRSRAAREALRLRMRVAVRPCLRAGSGAPRS